MEIQAVWFNKTLWSESSGIVWMAANNFVFTDIVEADESYIYRIFPTNLCCDGSFRVIANNFPDGVSATVCDTSLEAA